MKRNLLLLLSGAFCLIIISGFSNGTAYIGNLNCTGSYGSQDNCSGGTCHSANTGVNLTMFVRNLNGDTIKDFRYYPGAYYDIILAGNIIGSQNAFPKYSFQFSASSDNLNGGTFTPTTGLRQIVVGAAKIVEPTIPFSTGTNNSFNSVIYYQAPGGGAQSPGKWQLFATVLGANNDNSPSNDKAYNIQLEFSPIPVSVGSIDENVAITAYPNPVKDQLNVKFQDADAGIYTVGAYNIQGQLVNRTEFNISGSVYNASIVTASWPSGAYTVEVLKGEKRRLMHVIKR